MKKTNKQNGTLKSDPEFENLLDNVNKTALKQEIGASFAKHKIIIISGKGGVGKSTIAVNTAVSLANLGFSVGIIDLDFTGPSVAKLLRIESEIPEVLENRNVLPIIVPGFNSLKAISLALFLKTTETPVIWRGSMKFKAIKNFLYEVEWGSLDYLIFDLPPGTSDEPLTIAQQIPDIDGAIIITSPQDVATLDVKKAIMFLRKLNIKPLGLIENMSGFKCSHCDQVTYIFGKNGGKFLSDSMGVPYLGSLPIDPLICESGDQGNPFISSYPDLAFSKQFKDIIISISNRLEKN